MRSAPFALARIAIFGLPDPATPQPLGGWDRPACRALPHPEVFAALLADDLPPVPARP